ncbi:MAG: zinc ribbon domain-containing protein [Candidatus Omnitrophica bacterium]|nr:zinc ribbon domain-containing protein [Candidatus Omnitrophota bacterium]
MPIYEYICNHCKKTFEHLLRSLNEEVFCPYCKSKDLKKKLSLFSFGSRDSKGEFKAATSSKCSGCQATTCSSCF